MLKKSRFSPARPRRAETRLSHVSVLASNAPSQRSPLGELAIWAAWGGGERNGTPPVPSSAAVLLDVLFEQPAGGYSWGVTIVFRSLLAGDDWEDGPKGFSTEFWHLT
jgi:hypothetical protein